jgi:hypothetical protein
MQDSMFLQKLFSNQAFGRRTTIEVYFQELWLQVMTRVNSCPYRRRFFTTAPISHMNFPLDGLDSFKLTRLNRLRSLLDIEVKA